MPELRTLSLDEIKDLANRFAVAAGSMKVPRPLRTDLVLTALLIRVLLWTGVIAGPVTLGERNG